MFEGNLYAPHRRLIAMSLFNYPVLVVAEFPAYCASRWPGKVVQLLVGENLGIWIIREVFTIRERV